MARALGEGTGAARADVWVRLGEELRPEATWPEEAGAPPPRATSSSEERVASASTFFEPVRHRDELLGALSIEKRAGESLDGDRGEADPGPGGTGRTRDAERGPHRGSAGHDRTAPDVAAAARHGAGRGAPEARAEPARRCAAAARGAHREARAARAAGRARPRAGEDDRRTAPGGCDRGARGAPGPRARDLPTAPGRPGAGRGARIAGPEVDGAGHDRGRRCGAVRARGRGGRVLLVPGSAAERREVRLGLARDRASERRRRAPSLRGDRRRRGFRSFDVFPRHRAPGDRRTGSRPWTGTSRSRPHPVPARASQERCRSRTDPRTDSQLSAPPPGG